MRWPRSLAGRVVLVQGIAILLVAIALPLTGVWLLRDAAKGEQHRVLDAQASAIARGFSARSGTVALPAGLDQVFDTAYDGRAFVVVDRRDGPVAGSRYADAIPWERVPLAAQRRAFSLPPFTGISLPIRRGRARYWIVVAQDTGAQGVIVGRVVEGALGRFSLVVLPLLLTGAILNYFLLRRLVVSVEHVARQAQGIAAETLDVRLVESRLPSEVVPIVHAVNELVSRLEESFAAQAHFVGNVVHELRTPLTTLTMQVDAIADPAVRGRLAAQIDRVGHVVTQLRDLAALEGPRDPGVAIDLAAIARETVAEWAPLALESGHDIALHGAAAPVPASGNPVLVALAIANLVSNAIRHTPPGTAIRVRLLRNAVVVEDDGPGVTRYAPGNLTQRFWRADQKRSDSAGIGLAIVRKIMELGGGTIDIGASASGGAMFTLRFPPPAD